MAATKPVSLDQLIKEKDNKGLKRFTKDHNKNK
jgi:hypothetical protein